MGYFFILSISVTINPIKDTKKISAVNTTINISHICITSFLEGDTSRPLQLKYFLIFNLVSFIPYFNLNKKYIFFSLKIFSLTSPFRAPLISLFFLFTLNFFGFLLILTFPFFLPYSLSIYFDCYAYFCLCEIFHFLLPWVPCEVLLCWTHLLIINFHLFYIKLNTQKNKTINSLNWQLYLFYFYQIYYFPIILLLPFHYKYLTNYRVTIYLGHIFQFVPRVWPLNEGRILLTEFATCLYSAHASKTWWCASTI